MYIFEKIIIMKLFLITGFFFLFSCNLVSSQNLTKDTERFQIGPKGTDTSTFCKIYLFRETDNLTNFSFGLQCVGYYGIFARVYSGNAYEINCAPVGKREFFFETGTSGKKSIELDLQSKSVFYLKLTASGTFEVPEIILEELTKENGMEFKNKFSNKMNIRYSTIPYQNSYFRSDMFRDDSNVLEKMQDSADYEFSKTQHFSFLYPERLDGGMTVMGIQSRMYLSRTVSLTYSELFTIKFLGKLKVKSADEFKEHLNKEIIEPIITKKQTRYKNYQSEIVKINDHSMGNYSALIYLNYEDHEAPNKEENSFLSVNDVYRFISWKNKKGKLEWAAFILSERGAEKELRDKDEFLKGFEHMDKSIQLHTDQK